MPRRYGSGLLQVDCDGWSVAGALKSVVGWLIALAQFPHPRAAGAINPAVLAAFPATKSKFPTAPVAPAMSPTQLISQQQQQHPA
ncbi:hypothetical protein C0995_006657, partial [Termitomyces sp. Mi166